LNPAWAEPPPRASKDELLALRSAPEITEISADVIATLQSMEVTSTGPDGKQASAQVVATSVWKKLPEGWRIVLAHESLIQ
jgi:ketosteroid isomerase-like protein